MKLLGENNGNHKKALKRTCRYEAFWGREPDFVLHCTDSLWPHIDVYRFPPVKIKWFFQKWFKPVSYQYVYISGGMSDADMPIGEAAEIVPTRVELTAYSNEIYTNYSGETDMVAWWLSFLASAPFRLKEKKLFFAPGHTFSTGEPIIPSSEMIGFFFSITPSVELRRLCSCSVNAKTMLHVVPISESERKLAQEKGSDKLIAYFEKYNIEPIFNLTRKPFI